MDYSREFQARAAEELVLLPDRSAISEMLTRPTHSLFGHAGVSFEPRHPKLAELMRRAEEDVLAYKTFPRDHWPKIHSTNPLERLNKEIKRRTNVIGIFPNEAAITRLVGALMLEQSDEWAVTRRCMTLETVAAVCEDNDMDPALIAAL